MLPKLLSNPNPNPNLNLNPNPDPDPNPDQVLPKLLWLSRHEPAALVATTAVHLAAHDFLFTRLAAPAAEAGGGAAGGGGTCGTHVTDATNASTTGLLLASGGGWAEALLLEAGLPERLVRIPCMRKSSCM